MTFLDAADAVAEADSVKLVLSHTYVHRFQPKGLDIPLNIYVSLPETEAPQDGFPVLYAFDADLSFLALANMAQTVGRMARKAKLAPPMVVAIGYTEPGIWTKRRTYDLTPPTDIRKMPKRPNGQPWPKTGGGDAFLDVLIDEIKPLIRSKYPVDRSAETLSGHSLGGLLALHALHTREGAFDRYVASSPSLWFGAPETSEKLIAFQERTASGTSRKIPLRLTVGLAEESPTRWHARSGESAESRKAWLENGRMVGNSKDLAEALARIDGAIKLSFETYSGLGHAAASFPALYQALEFAVAPDTFYQIAD